MTQRWRGALAFSALALTAGGGLLLSGPAAVVAQAVTLAGIPLAWLTVSRAAAAPPPRDGESWLRMALRDVSDAVAQCDLEHRILSLNAAAERMFGVVLEDGAPLSLASLMAKAPLDHGRDCLLARFDGLGRPSPEALGNLVLAARPVNRHSLCKGLMSLVFAADGNPCGYLVTFRPADEHLLAGHPLGAVNAAVIRDLRGRLGSLCGAAQALADFPEMTARQRTVFTEVIEQEYRHILPDIDRLAVPEADGGASAWLMGDLHFSELFASVSVTLRQRLDLTLRMVGVPMWLRGDSLSLREALLAIFANLHAHTRQYEFDLECMLSDRQVFIDVNWQGKPISEHLLAEWLKSEINTPIGPCRAQDVFDRHDSEPWSLAKGSGIGTLRVALPLPRRPQFCTETDQTAVLRGIAGHG